MKSLHLLPNILHEDSTWKFDPPPIEALIAESEKGGRQYLKRFFGKITLPIYLLNEHTHDIHSLLQISEDTVGLISDAGLPCLADPGASLVLSAREKKVAIFAYPGPSSIILSLMLSGLPAQQFTFHGYLEREPSLLHKQLISLSPHMTHIFIETPYRNQKMLDAILKARHPKDLLCIASNLMGPDESVITQTISAWKNVPPLPKIPAIFLISSREKF